MSWKKIARALVVALALAGSLEALARGVAPPPSAAPVNSDGFHDREWKLELTPGVRRMAVTGARFDARLAQELERRLGRVEVMNLTGEPLERSLEVAARYRPSIIVHVLDAPVTPGFECPSRALTFAIERGRAFFAPDEDRDDTGAAARTRALCELRETADSFGASVRVLVVPGGRFEARALRSCEAAGVDAVVVHGDPVEALVPSLRM